MASRAPNGSSSSSVRAPAARARAKATRWRCPPESSCGQRAPKRAASSPTRRIASAASVAGSGRPSSHGTSATLRATLQCGSSPPSCGHVAERAPDGDRIAGRDVVAGHPHRAGVDHGQAVEGTEQRGLARSALAHERHALAVGHGERRVVQGHDPAELLRDARRRQREAGHRPSEADEGAHGERRHRPGPVLERDAVAPDHPAHVAGQTGLHTAGRRPPASHQRAPTPACAVVPVSTSASRS